MKDVAGGDWPIASLCELANYITDASDDTRSINRTIDGCHCLGAGCSMDGVKKRSSSLRTPSNIVLY